MPPNANTYSGPTETSIPYRPTRWPKTCWMLPNGSRASEATAVRRSRCRRARSRLLYLEDGGGELANLDQRFGEGVGRVGADPRGQEDRAFGDARSHRGLGSDGGAVLGDLQDLAGDDPKP